ncbi:hypothetical protein B0T25DRAFT_537007 [Lasiosphaeria hispida]|uniref:Indoleamine 2,3-dioxygenase n=1 Tax=Lasiosphaeria hispida TaxID=260671 RepID=A0AAJ0HKJ0_9PEZI|nr:hypothetical protein B0T25DRAFT_537007 [Lasiosphaeria hispida]
MFLNPEYVILSVIGSIVVALMSLSSRRPLTLKHLKSSRFPFKIRRHDSTYDETTESRVRSITELAEYHETAARLANMIHKDGAGTWPPRAEHAPSYWPPALRPFREIYQEMAPLLPEANPSLDDDVNRERIAYFRSRFWKLLSDKVNLEEVSALLAAAEAGRWDVFPRDVYNAFYVCVAWCRHAYRWGTIPAVRVAQLEKTISLPPELVSTWASLQRHFGLDSDSGNMMSCLILNFSPSGEYALKINTGLSSVITSSEEEFARICNEMEALAVPIYHDIVRATISFARGDKSACLNHIQGITSQLRPLLSSYYDRVHDAKIARSAWLSHVQGFFAWGAGYEDESSGEWEKFDGLSGNQVLLFQALDAFLGLEVYLPKQVLLRNVPQLQREFCEAVGRHTFRHQLGNEGVEGRIKAEFTEIVKRLRLFRSAHRTRAKFYLTVPAPERIPMTAGKSLLKDNMDESLEFLDQFMVSRLQQTV